MAGSGFTTQLRTALLLAGLSGLIVAVGALIGGAALPLFVVLAVVMNMGAYWFSDKVALKASHAQPLSQADAPQLYQDISELTGRAGLPMPRVYLIPSDQPNAFATGRNAKHAAVAVTQGLLTLMPRDQVRGVLAHELAHVRNHDILVTSIAATLGAVVVWIANMLQFSMFFGGSDEDQNPLAMIATIILAPVAAMLIQLGISRQREYLADATGARFLGDPEPLASALESLERATERIPMNANPATASLYIADPFKALHGRGMASLFSTHPPLEERVRRLRAMRSFA
ncbi:MAG: heat shock protein HtpX [Gaiellaceae bacterium]|nr:heat shock protein HtpX [Gaiellaceae bacterium]